MTGVFENVAFGVEFLRLADAPHGLDFGQDRPQDAGFGEQTQGLFGETAGEHAGHLFPDALSRKRRAAGREGADGRKSLFFDDEIERAGEPDRPEHAQIVLGKAF